MHHLPGAVIASRQLVRSWFQHWQVQWTVDCFSIKLPVQTRAFYMFGQFVQHVQTVPGWCLYSALMVSGECLYGALIVPVWCPHYGLLYLYLYHTCTVPVQYMYRACTVPVQYLYCAFTVPTQYLYRACTRPVQCLGCPWQLPGKDVEPAWSTEDHQLGKIIKLMV